LLTQQRQHFFPVSVITHDGLAVIAALDDVVRISGDGEAGLAGHWLRGTVKRNSLIGI
jgi:hypothetical protein